MCILSHRALCWAAVVFVVFILFPVLPVYVCITDQKLNFASRSPKEDAEYSTNASFAARRAQINFFLFLRDNAGLHQYMQLN